MFRSIVNRIIRNHVWIMLSTPDGNSRRTMIIYWRNPFNGIKLCSWRRGEFVTTERFLLNSGADLSY